MQSHCSRHKWRTTCSPFSGEIEIDNKIQWCTDLCKKNCYQVLLFRKLLVHEICCGDTRLSRSMESQKLCMFLLHYVVLRRMKYLTIFFYYYQTSRCIEAFSCDSAKKWWNCFETCLQSKMASGSKSKCPILISPFSFDSAWLPQVVEPVLNRISRFSFFVSFVHIMWQSEPFTSKSIAFWFLFFYSFELISDFTLKVSRVWSSTMRIIES